MTGAHRTQARKVSLLIESSMRAQGGPRQRAREGPTVTSLRMDTLSQGSAAPSWRASVFSDSEDGRSMPPLACAASPFPR
jgi:hypothetical protein